MKFFSKFLGKILQNSYKTSGREVNAPLIQCGRNNSSSFFLLMSVTPLHPVAGEMELKLVLNF